MNRRVNLCISIAFVVVLVLTACTSTGSGDEKVTLIYRDWEGVVPQSVLDDFEVQTGIHIDYQYYDAQEDAIAELRAGSVCDILVVENQLVSGMIRDGMLAEINYKNIPNFKNVSANFRDLAYDPGNRHSIPYSWGTTGLAVRTDAVSQPVNKWADLWKLGPGEKVVVWSLPRYTIGMALRGLGYSVNSENPEELEQALAKLIELKPRMIVVDWEPAVSTSYLATMEAVAGMGQADDQYAAEERNLPIKYILPQDGGLLWGDNYTIPVQSEHQQAAEEFINYLLSAEVAATIINETYYWLPNDAALPLVKPEIRENPAIFPTQASIEGSEIMLPLSPEGEALYADIWERFLAAQP